ncbi:MAG: hypothetical protein LUC90_03810 [Lachnospiraceae bacterium]|nr:hypothetical protein [Lachnospiraceae bacterium]
MSAAKKERVPLSQLKYGEKRMETCKKLLRKLFFLPGWLTLLIAIPSYALVIYVLSSGIQAGVFAYVSYGISAYALVITITGICRALTASIQKENGAFLPQKIRSHPMGEKYLTDHVFRAQVSLYAGFILNVLYIFLKIISGIVTNSIWLIAAGVYYSALTIIRYPLVRQMRHSGSKEIACRRSRQCAILLLSLNLALSGIVVLMIRENEHYNYPGMLIYAMTAYTFYSVTSSIINLVKYRKYQDSVLSAIRAVSLTKALVSMLFLETAMFSRFGQDTDSFFKSMMIGLTGGGICMITTSIAIVMILQTNKKLKQLRNSSL